MPPPPLPGSSRNFESSQMPPPPLPGSTGGTEFHPPTGEMQPPEMMGRPVEQRNGGDNKQEYQKEYQPQFGDEVWQQTKMRTQEMQKRFAPPPRPPGGSEFRPEGQPFMDGGRDSAQGRPFMGEDMQQGRPFGGPNMGGENMMGERSGFGGMGGEGEGMGGYEGEEGMEGPSAEEIEKMMEEREKMMQQEQLKQMKRGVVSGLGRGLKQIQSMMSKLQKKGITVPANAQALVSELTEALEKIKAATELTEDVEAAMEVIQEKGQDLGDVGQQLGMLERMSQIEKQIGKEFVRIDKMWAKAKKAKTASQYPEVVAKIEGEIGGLKQKWESARQGLLSGEGDEDMKDVVDEIFEEVGDVHRSIEMLRQLGSVSKMLKSADKEIVAAEKQIARQRKAGKDVTRLDELLAEAKSKMGEIKTLVRQSGFDPEDLFSLMQELQQIGDEAHDELDRITGKADTKQLQGAVIESLKLRRMGL